MSDVWLAVVDISAGGGAVVVFIADDAVGALDVIIVDVVTKVVDVADGVYVAVVILVIICV